MGYYQSLVGIVLQPEHYNALKHAAIASVQVLRNSTEMYSEKDLYVGKVLSVHQRTFELLEADEFTYQYMENNRHVYLMADWEAALKAIQAQLQGQPWPKPSVPGIIVGVSNCAVAGFEASAFSTSLCVDSSR